MEPLLHTDVQKTVCRVVASGPKSTEAPKDTTFGRQGQYFFKCAWHNIHQLFGKWKNNK